MRNFLINGLNLKFYLYFNIGLFQAYNIYIILFEYKLSLLKIDKFFIILVASKFSNKVYDPS